MKQRAVVTGTNRGIGLEFVRQLLSSGWDVVATARKPLESRALQNLKENFPDQLRVEDLDLENMKSLSDFASRMMQVGQPVDLLINNSGVFLDKNQDKLQDLELETFKKSFRVNTLGPVFLTQKLLELIRKSKNSKIVNITSLMGSIGDNKSGGAYAYRMSKAALNMFNRCLSYELPDTCCVVIHPGWVQTGMGGELAKITPEESVSGMLSVISDLDLSKTGRFFNYLGEELPW